MNKLLIITLGAMLFVSSCAESPTSDNLTDSLEPVEDVVLIKGAENSEISLRKSAKAFFEINFSNINSNDIIQNGKQEGWCIDWTMPISSNGEAYSNISLYSTYNVKGWRSLNYLFNIIDDIKRDDPDITFKEVQIVIWSLRGNPVFDLNTISNEDLPSSMHENGEPLFSREKVDKILGIVESGYRDFVPTATSRFAVVAETPADTQTVITVVN
ncbi:hypothetical protein [Rhodohalobacter sp.]|uniref:hypothetical protein n=1 Tax=Rhodohalobacter sp. TaxID=1974210 RepID=UPI002ACD8C34|nr:hypothetical protein [Rhodohalobacter sp.]MDZ7755826.1 hypothetical protein [Rhodohalobacter sp.]